MSVLVVEGSGQASRKAAGRHHFGFPVRISQSQQVRFPRRKTVSGPKTAARNPDNHPWALGRVGPAASTGVYAKLRPRPPTEPAGVMQPGGTAICLECSLLDSSLLIYDPGPQGSQPDLALR